MKTPISYYGGKQVMADTILPLIPQHKIYIEPFFGGGAVFFAKPLAETNIINDTNDFVINFWRECKTNFEPLQEMIQTTLHSETLYKKAAEILKTGSGTPTEQAWAFWVQTSMSFSNGIFKGFAFSKNKREVRKTRNKIAAFTNNISSRLQYTAIFNRDALDLIPRFDTPDSFFYLDPPYVSSDCAHYKGTWGAAEQEKLIKILENLQGKFILSGYPADLTATRKWYRREFTKNLSVDGRHNAGKKKTEVLIMNYVPVPELFTPEMHH